MWGHDGSRVVRPGQGCRTPDDAGSPLCCTNCGRTFTRARCFDSENVGVLPSSVLSMCGQVCSEEKKRKEMETEKVKETLFLARDVVAVLFDFSL